MNIFSRILLNKKQYPLSYRLLFYVVICSSLFALLATITQLYFEYKADVSSIDKNFQLIEESYLSSISNAVYKINEEQLRFLLDGMIKLQNIESLEVKEIRGSKKYLFSAGNPDVEKGIIRNFPLEHFKPSGQIISIGTLTATASLKDVYQRLWSRIIIVLTTNMIKTFLASFCILLIIQFLITRHLNKIANYARQLDLNQLDLHLILREKVTEFSGPDEIDQIVIAINTLQERIATSLAKRKQAEDALQKAHDKLELKVEERTKELQDTNKILVSEISQRQKAEESLKRFRSVMDQAGEAIFITDINTGAFIDINETACKQLGYDREELLQFGIKDIELKYKSQPDLSNHLKGVKKVDESIIIEDGIHQRKDGSTYPVEVSISSKTINNRPLLLAIARDITDRKQAENQIKASLKEKETLLKEIHHRVKNNLTVISSLLGLQITRVSDEKAKEALQDSRDRVKTMSMIHETLYRSDNLSSINMENYLSELGRIIFKGYNVSGKVNLKIEAANVMISVKQASSLGLIVNELITNSLKYAFPDDRKGEIVLKLKLEREKEVELTVSDNGVGIPEGLDLQNADSLGLKLVKAIVENQLDGSIDIESNNGTKFTIKFNIEVKAIEKLAGGS